MMIMINCCCSSSCSSHYDASYKTSICLHSTSSLPVSNLSISFSLYLSLLSLTSWTLLSSSLSTMPWHFLSDRRTPPCASLLSSQLLLFILGERDERSLSFFFFFLMMFSFFISSSVGISLDLLRRREKENKLFIVFLSPSFFLFHFLSLLFLFSQFLSPSCFSSVSLFVFLRRSLAVDCGRLSLASLFCDKGFSLSSAYSWLVSSASWLCPCPVHQRKRRLGHCPWGCQTPHAGIQRHG